MKESEKKKGEGKKTCSSVIFFVPGKETEFPTYWARLFKTAISANPRLNRLIAD